jgi:hypothetical protein
MGEVRQGALEGLVVKAIARASGLAVERIHDEETHSILPLKTISDKLIYGTQNKAIKPLLNESFNEDKK